jgi:hypothetical protein
MNTGKTFKSGDKVVYVGTKKVQYHEVSPDSVYIVAKSEAMFSSGLYAYDRIYLVEIPKRGFVSYVFERYISTDRKKENTKFWDSIAE